MPSRTSGKSLKRRKAIGGLRPARTVFSDVEENGDTTEEHKAQEKSTSVRHLQSDVRFFPQRRKRPPKQPSLQPSTLDRLIQSVWEQIYGNIKFDPQLMVIHPTNIDRQVQRELIIFIFRLISTETPRQ